MRALSPFASPPPQDWGPLREGDRVLVDDRSGFLHEAEIEAKSADSSIIWIRRTDLNTRHLLEWQDGVRLTPLGPPRHR